ncbi:MAG TPA: hypothetical protein VMU64_01080 [Acidimicrobiales bacterium]|nr:hypothetical protein [Acidimicrobiales bacterium]
MGPVEARFVDAVVLATVVDELVFDVVEPAEHAANTTVLTTIPNTAPGFGRVRRRPTW